MEFGCSLLSMLMVGARGGVWVLITLNVDGWG